MTRDGRRDAAGELRNAIVDALGAVSFVDRLPDRRLMINLLRAEVSDFPDVPERDEARLHVIAIVVACMATRGGLRSLRAVLALMAPQAPGTRRVDELVRSATLDSLLLENERHRTHTLLERAGKAPSGNGGWRAAAGDVLSSAPDALSLVQAFDYAAARQHERHGVLAGLILIDRVAAQLDGTLRVEMISLTEHVAERLEVTERLVAARPGSTRPVVEPSPAVPEKAEPAEAVDGPEARDAPTVEPDPQDPLAVGDDSSEKSDLPDTVIGAEADTEVLSDAEIGEGMSPVAESRRSQGRLPQVWGDVPQRNQEFTGREELLSRLHHELEAVGETAVLPKPIHGMGGVGKSQIAIEYVHKHSGEYDLVWWVPSEHIGQIQTSLTSLAQRLNLDVSPEANSAVRAVKEALSTGKTGYHDWLLVFDNAEDPAQVREFFPTGGAGKIIITSRNPEWGRGALPIEVDTFERDESVRFLTNRNPNLSQFDADRLAEALGDLPLAIEQAAAWHQTTAMPVPEYLELLENKRLELFDQEPPPDYRLTVRAAWKLSLEQLREVNLGALQLLQVCSYFAPEPISRKLFAGSPTAPISDELDATLSDTFRLSRAIRDIQRYALAKIDHRHNTLQIHRLIRLVLDDSMDEEQKLQMRHGAHTMLANNNPLNPSRSEEWPRYGSLRPHVDASRAVESQDPRVQELVAGIARYLYYWGDHQGSEQLSAESLGYRRIDRGPNDPHTLRLAKWVGWMYFTNGKLAEARQLNADTLARYREHFGEEDEGTLDAMWVVAGDMRAAGDFQAALELDQKAVETGRRVLGDDDPAYLDGAHNMGVTLRLLGRFTDALKLDTVTWEKRKVVRGNDDSATMNTRNGMLIDMRESGQYIEACQLEEKLYAEHLALFQKDAPATLLVARTLAVMRRKAGDHPSALKLNQDTFERYRDRYDENYPNTIATALNLAVDLRHAGDLGASRELSEWTVRKYHKIFGPRHVFTLSARINLAIVLRHQNEIGAAYEHNRECVEILTDTLGPAHPITLVAETNLATTLADRGDFSAAFELDTDTLARSERALGVEHPSTLACSVNVALDLRGLDRVAEADKILADTMMRLRRVLGERHPATLNALQNVRADCDADPMPI
ncbi:tetratricopeptide repeat protein [Actinoplanes bogorensis]|uniref:Tetratricopeptide repeat protein n=1 Tax=Paractinoplanes bogorensis TaxID=1610840 RepID=A0ABS5Z0G6_9ACTN|nr:FxSxx-COOH system tetratricopeptide repeat protein [Actinoplanes bogorensis]MBU2667890.1 tetratricopeptide repeat protein [Actinoplanes bogorensis]